LIFFISRLRLTTPPENILGDARPVFSPDGRKLAFTRSDGGAENIYVVPVSGGESRQVSFDNCRIQSLCWMPDGRQLIYASNRSGSFQLWKVRESGGAPEQVTSVGSGPTDVAISPDGSSLAFAQTSFDTNIWRFEPAGGHPSDTTGRKWTLTDQGIYFAISTPSASLLKFCSFATGRVTDVTMLPKKPIYGPPGLAVSPDVRSILYVQRDSSSSDIMVVENFH
jgi:Tol biopolymer transport system component